jgi:uncharacterized phage protein gp47/JayE
MSLDYPTFQELVEQARAEMQTQLPSVDPTVGGSWARAFVDGSAVMAQIVTFLVRDLEEQLFPQTATGEFLELWGNYEGLERLGAAGASGYITLEGSLGTLIPALTEFVGSNGYVYATQSVSSVANVSQNITSITRSGSVATVTCPNNHNLASGVSVTVSGSDQTEYNITAPVVVTSGVTFQYSVSGTPVTPATGTMVYSAIFASILVSATDTGVDTNMDGSGQLSNTTYGTGIVQYGGLSGGSENETDDDYRDRILLSRSIISGVFTPDQIRLAAMSVSGNSRVFVKKPSLSVCSGSSGDYTNPVPGQVSVFILRDDVVTQTIIDKTREAIINDGALPSEMSSVDLFVQAPDIVPTDFNFDSLVPDTPTMRTAILNQLSAFFNDSVEFEKTITTTEYLCVIQSSQSTETGEYIKSFTLSTPTTDITIGDGEIATLGEVTYSV